MGKLEAESSNSKDEETVAVLPRTFESEENMEQSHDKNQPADSINADTPQLIRVKDISVWMFATTSQWVQDHLQQKNIINFRSSPTSYAAHCIQQNSVVSSIRILFNEPILRHIRKCTITKAQRATGIDKLSVNLNNLDKIIGLVIARGVIGGRTFPNKSIWTAIWGCNLFSQTMPRDRFLKIIKYLRFNLKTERRRNLLQDKFCLALSLWNPFIENCQKANIPDANITIDKQLLPCKARCKFIQYMANNHTSLV